MKLAQRIAGCSVLVMGLSALTALAQPEQWLQYRTTTEPRGYRWQNLTNQAPPGVALPKFSAPPYFVYWSTPLDPKGGRWMCFDRSRKSGPYDILYADSNGNGRLDDDTPLKTTRREDSMAYFEPVKFVFRGEDGPITYHLICRYYKYNEGQAEALIGSGAFYEGKVDLGGRKRQVQLIDYTVNGSFNDVGSKPSDSDRITVDGPSGISRYLGRYVEVDNQLYEIQVARDGAFIKTKKSQGVALGNVRVPETITSFEAVGANGHFARKPAKGEFALPQGKYRVHAWSIDRKDDKGAAWQMSGYGFTEFADFQVESATSTTLPIGEPARALLEATERRDSISFSLRFSGQLGESVEFQRNNERPRAPQLLMTSVKGDFSATNKFEYG